MTLVILRDLLPVLCLKCGPIGQGHSSSVLSILQ